MRSVPHPGEVGFGLQVGVVDLRARPGWFEGVFLQPTGDERLPDPCWPRGPRAGSAADGALSGVWRPAEFAGRPHSRSRGPAVRPRRRTLGLILVARRDPQPGAVIQRNAAERVTPGTGGRVQRLST